MISNVIGLGMYGSIESNKCVYGRLKISRIHGFAVDCWSSSKYTYHISKSIYAKNMQLETEFYQDYGHDETTEESN